MYKNGFIFTDSIASVGLILCIIPVMSIMMGQIIKNIEDVFNRDTINQCAISYMELSKSNYLKEGSLNTKIEHLGPYTVKGDVVEKELNNQVMYWYSVSVKEGNKNVYDISTYIPIKESKVSD